MAAFAQFGSDLDAATQEQLANGERQTEILKQGQYSPLQMEEQVVAIYASTPQLSNNRPSWIRELALTDILRYERELLDWMRSTKQGILDAIKTTGKFDDETEQQLIAALDEFANIFQPTAAKGSGSEAA
jgi:F-type H+-transporting ATPase subunit alpha